MFKLIVIFLTFIITMPLFSGVKFENALSKSQVPSSWSRIVAKGNKVCFTYQSSYDHSIGKYYFSLLYFESNTWQEPPKPYELFNYNAVDIDKSGNLWVTADDGLWKYDWNSWQKYVVNDSFDGTRQYFRLCIDSSGNIWVATRTAFIKYQGSGGTIFNQPIYHELFKFDGKSFETMDYYAINSLHVYTGDYGLTAAPNGTVLAHDFDVYGTDDDLFFFKNNQKTSMKIHNPHYEVDYFDKDISQIYYDKVGNIWFCQTEDLADPGLTVLKQDGTWQTINKDKGYYLHSYKEYIKDTSYLGCNAIYQDNNKIYWVGGYRFFGYLDDKWELRIPDDDFYNNCTLYGNDFYDLTKNDSARREYLYAITHYPEFMNRTDYSASMSSRLLGITETDDGSIWFMMQHFGILRYQPTVGVNESENSAQSDVAMYPQPVSLADGIVNFRLGSNLTAKTIRIYSATGSLIVQKDCNYAVGSVQLQIPKNIAQACYFVEIICTDKVFRKMLIITN